jgi:phage FluMu protein Com
MFGRSSKETTSIVSEFFDKKSRQIQKKNKIFRSKVNQALHGEHRHYFSKQDVSALGQNARCKVCDMLLSEFRVQRRIEDWSPHLKPIHNTEQLSDTDQT